MPKPKSLMRLILVLLLSAPVVAFAEEPLAKMQREADANTDDVYAQERVIHQAQREGKQDIVNKYRRRALKIHFDRNNRNQYFEHLETYLKDSAGRNWGTDESTEMSSVGVEKLHFKEEARVFGDQAWSEFGRVSTSIHFKGNLAGLYLLRLFQHDHIEKVLEDFGTDVLQFSRTAWVKGPFGETASNPVVRRAIYSHHGQNYSYRILDYRGDATDPWRPDITFSDSLDRWTMSHRWWAEHCTRYPSEISRSQVTNFNESSNLMSDSGLYLEAQRFLDFPESKTAHSQIREDLLQIRANIRAAFLEAGWDELPTKSYDLEYEQKRLEIEKHEELKKKAEEEPAAKKKEDAKEGKLKKFIGALRSLPNAVSNKLGLGRASKESPVNPSTLEARTREAKENGQVNSKDRESREREGREHRDVRGGRAH